ncbi:hypothetical protein FHX42_004737 [Saccharopolyspora lacisalsi]|uniref:PASTA domain-containing protein n=1 Tax=Halosaccharopolyspora lacisalsi TaxID=1000566 RepID=A0A839E265_9PSEU|nr:hypothetical protein [Halosaccharopolyspora lacisalsi]MBA8827353.1 hypothetical protein [Halosaccharopolyspora lacisalsi]
MSRHRRRFVVISLALAASGTALAGCGRSAENPALDPGVVTTSPSTPAPTAPRPPDQRHEGTGDAWAREHAGNNGWKQHYELSSPQQEIADAAATRLRPKLRRLQAAGDFSPEALRNALVESGLEPVDVVSRTGRPPLARFWSTPRSGVCVNGKLTTESVVVETGGPSLDGGCEESGGGH